MIHTFKLSCDLNLSSQYKLASIGLIILKLDPVHDYLYLLTDRNMTPLFNKLNLKDHKEMLILNSPQSFSIEIESLDKTITVYKDLKKSKQVGFAMGFVTTREQIGLLIPSLNEKLIGDSILWICYPKGTSKKYTCDFNRDTGWEILGKYDFEPVRQVSIDEDWSALRFRRVQFIKTMKRSFAYTEEGKIKSKSK